MNYKSKTVIIFAAFIILLIGAMISLYVFVGEGSKQIKAAKSFMNKLESNNIITIDKENNDYKSTKKSDPEKKKEYYTNEAVVHGVESRTSSPVKIPRDKETLEHPQIKGFYPCGEGAGYAGGIVSAAIDGERCAEAAASKK